jgi:hypothetical protein
MSGESILEVVSRFFVDDDWPLAPHSSGAALQTKFKGREGKWDCLALAREEERQFVFYSIVRRTAPEERRAAVEEFVTRANWGTTIGNFELDLDSGEIRYRTSIDVEGAELTEPLVRQVVYPNVFLVDRYFSALEAVVSGDEEPAAAVARAERDA